MLLRWVIAGLVAAVIGISQIHSVHAQGAFAQGDAPFANGATAVAAGDVDGDGKVDMWFGYSDESRVYHWVENTIVDSGQSLAAESIVVDVALGDLDGDSDLDAITIDLTNITIWINRGGTQAGQAGSFQLHDSFPNDFSNRLALGDLDDDDDLDMILAQGGDRPDTVWLNDGAGNFSDSGLRLGEDFSTDVALGDIDGDNDLDAVIATGVLSGGDPVPVNRIWLNTTNHVTPSAQLFIDSGLNLGTSSGISLALGDVDGDEDLDVWIGGLNSGDTLWINQGGSQAGTAGTFSQSIQELGGPTRDVVFADVDNDDDLDAVVARSGSGVRVWLNQGGLQSGVAGNFAFRGQTVSVNVERITLANINGDEYPDLLIAPYAGENRKTGYWVNGDQASIETYQDVRDDLLRNFVLGRHYIGLYQQFSDELVQLMLTNPTLGANLYNGLAIWQPTLKAFVEGGDAIITETHVQQLEVVLEELEEVGSESLQTAIATERQAIGKPLISFAGKSMIQANADLLGDPSFQLFVPTLHRVNQSGAIIASPLQLCAVSCIFGNCGR